MIGVDLFAGSGGLSEGAEQAGIDVKFAVENEPNAAATYAYNHSDTHIFREDIRKIHKVDICCSEHIDIVFGGSPCQGFSTSNQKTRGRKNPENWLFLEFLRVVTLLMPNWVLFENVTGIAETDGGFFLKELMAGLKKRGYTCSNWVLNAADYGAPQMRNRLFVIGSLQGINVASPESSVERHLTVSEAISDLPTLPNGADLNWMPYKSESKSDYSSLMRGNGKQSPNHLVTNNSANVIERYKHIPQGGNWGNIPIALMANYKDTSRCHTRIYHRLDGSIPSVVIGNYRKNMLIHPTEDRGLSVREAARLQSFRDSYEFQGSIGFQQQQVGNAVPPLLAFAVFKAIIDADSETRNPTVARIRGKIGELVCVD